MRAFPLVAVLFAACASSAPTDDPRLVPRWDDAGSPATSPAEIPPRVLLRERWLSLDGEWRRAPAHGDALPPPASAFVDRVVVPMPSPASELDAAPAHERAWYRTTFTVPDEWRGESVLLQLGGVDGFASVWVDRCPVGDRSGSGAFGFDVTAALESGREHELVVGLGVGREKRDRAPSSGIVRAVWIEPVPPVHVARVVVEPSVAEIGTVRVHAVLEGIGAIDTLRLRVKDGATVAGEIESDFGGALQPGTVIPALAVGVEGARAWTRDEPKLYEVEARVTSNGKVVDLGSVRFAFRSHAETTGNPGGSAGR